MIDQPPKLELATLTVKIKADTNDLTSSSSKLRSFTTNIKSSNNDINKSFVDLNRNTSKNANIFTRNIGTMARRTKSILHTIRGSFLGFATTINNIPFFGKAIIGLGTIQTINALDNLEVLQRRLKASGFNKQGFNSVVGMSARTGSDLSSNIKLLETLNIQRGELGITKNSQSVDFVESLANIGKIAGLAPQETSSIMTQLTHSLAGGKLTARALNTLLDHSVIFVKKLSEGLGFDNISDIKKEVHKGNITSKDVVRGYSNVAPEVKKEAKSINNTMWQEFQNVGSNVMQAIHSTPILSGIADIPRKWLKAINEVSEMFKEIPEEKQDKFAGTSFDGIKIRDYDPQKNKEIVKKHKELLAEKKHKKNLLNQDKLFALSKVELIKDMDKLSLMERSEFFRAEFEEASKHSLLMANINSGLNMMDSVITGINAVNAAYSFANEGSKSNVLGLLFGGLTAFASGSNIAEQISGNRAGGGSVSATSVYKINEHGDEILTKQGTDYLLTGNNSGHITPSGNKQDVVINIVNNSSAKFDVKKRESEHNQKISILVSDIDHKMAYNIYNNQSQIAQALKFKYGI